MPIFYCEGFEDGEGNPVSIRHPSYEWEPDDHNPYSDLTETFWHENVLPLDWGWEDPEEP